MTGRQLRAERRKAEQQRYVGFDDYQMLADLFPREPAPEPEPMDGDYEPEDGQ